MSNLSAISMHHRDDRSSLVLGDVQLFLKTELEVIRKTVTSEKALSCLTVVRDGEEMNLKLCH